MNDRLANYTIVIEQDTRTGSNQPCYTAYVPILGLAADDDTLEGVQREVRALIEFHIQSLTEEGQAIPVEHKDSVIAKSQIMLPDNALVAD